MVYLDDVLVIGKTFEEQIENLDRVFLRLEEAGLRLKPKKCNLAQTRVEYLGYVVFKDRITADPRYEPLWNFLCPLTSKLSSRFWV